MFVVCVSCFVDVWLVCDFFLCALGRLEVGSRGSGGPPMLKGGGCVACSEGMGGLAVLRATSRKLCSVRIFSTASSLASKRPWTCSDISSSSVSEGGEWAGGAEVWLLSGVGAVLVCAGDGWAMGGVGG